MTSIGGYFGLELRDGPEYHPDAIRLNTGRNALEYILQVRKYRKIYLPYYTCHVLLQPLEKLGIAYDYYSIDEQLEPRFDYSGIGADEGFLYTNYFGLKDAFLPGLKAQARNLIIDNAQAFFAMPLEGVDTFYSPRKFMGVPDGAYVYTDRGLNEEFEQDQSRERCAHLLIRAEETAEKGYKYFVENDESLDNNPIRIMSRLSQKILQSVDYESHKEIRRRNYNYLEAALGQQNGLKLQLHSASVPMVYPYLGAETDLRRRLIEQRVYVAQYWSEVKDIIGSDSIEYRYAEGLIPLPVDQRLSIADLDTIIKIIRGCTSKAIM